MFIMTKGIKEDIGSMMTQQKQKTWSLENEDF